MTLVEDDFGSQIVWCPCQKLQNSIGDVPMGRASQEDSAPKLCSVFGSIYRTMKYFWNTCTTWVIVGYHTVWRFFDQFPWQNQSRWSECHPSHQVASFQAASPHKRQSLSSQDWKKNLKPTMVNPLEQVTSTCCTHVRQLTKFYCNGLQLEMKTLRSR